MDPELPEQSQVPQGPYRIHTVSELTGVPEPTLRAWERRYGIPRPERTASGYRLYDAAEVEQVRQLRRMCEGGIAASDAARILLTRKGDAAVGIAAHRDAEEVASQRPVSSAYEGAIAAVMSAVLQFDDAALDHELRKLMFLGTATAILDGVVTPVLYEIGNLWHSGKLSVGQEHLATQRIGTLLRDLVRLAPGAHSESAVVLASFADDEHELGLLAMALRLSEWSFRPVFLGAKTPPSAVRSAVDALSPVLVALSVTVTPHPARGRELVDDYANACRGVPWMVGGAAAEDLRAMVLEHGGAISPTDPSELRRAIGALVGQPKPRPSTSKPRMKK